MQLKQGTLLQGGKYRIERELGSGGFGITYLAEHTLLGMKVAIKEFFMKEYCNRDETTSHVSVGSEGSREMVEKFRVKFIKEARNIAKLHHPNIVRVSDIFEENDTAYYVMEYCEGGSLSQRINMKYPAGMPVGLCMKYIRDIASALDYVHQRKMNHLDVKPANVILSQDNHAVLIDFGLSKQYDGETGHQTSSTPVGISEGYAPMEQYKKGGVSQFSPSTDIYSLGATLYKMITGQTPPNANDVLNDGLPAMPSSVPADVAAAITAAMQPRKSDRPQSIKAWLEMMQQSEGGAVPEEDEETISPEDEETVPPGYGQSSSFRPESDTQPIRPYFDPKSVTRPLPKSKFNTKIILLVVALVAIVSLLFGLCNGAGKHEDKPEEEAVEVVEEIIVADTCIVDVDSQSAEISEKVPTSGKHNGHEWVDLGLPSGTKWATMNVGASSPSDYGSYFAWGETSPKSSYNWSNLKYCLNNSGDKFSKYVTDSHYGNVDGKTTLELEDDAAHTNWGSGWRMPSKAQQDELREKCKWTWSTQEGHEGYKVVGLNGNSIFLPAAGCRRGNSVYEGGYYWSRKLCASYGIAYVLNFGSGDIKWSSSNRCKGLCVRAVCVSE